MSVWNDPSIARQQRELIERQLAEKPWPAHLTVYADAIRKVMGEQWRSVLEIGCGVGHGYEILEQEQIDPGSFTGIDISEAAIALARDRYRDCEWHCADAKTLPTFEQRDIVVDGSCVLHVSDWRVHLGHLCGASRDAAILHRIPIGEETSRWETHGYGHSFPAWIFRLSDVTDEMKTHGFEHTEARRADGNSLTLTFRKTGQ